jgi:hypothetical protein
MTSAEYYETPWSYLQKVSLASAILYTDLPNMFHLRWPCQISLSTVWELYKNFAMENGQVY